MKKLFTLCLLVVTMCAVAQEQIVKRIAIPEIVDKTGEVPTAIKRMLRISLTSTVARTPGYECISMPNAFQNDNQTPTVESYLLIAEVVPIMDDNIMVDARLLDAESASIIRATPPTMVSTRDLKKMQESFSQIGETLLSSQE